jgi:hypothetical protein
MDQTTLVMPDLSAGQEALAVLDQANIEQIAALFMLDEEYGSWRFVLSSPSLDQVHSLKAHEQVHAILRGQFVYRLPLLLILPVKDPFMRELRKKLGGRINASGRIPVSLEGLRIAGRYISAGYLLRFPGIMK